ncbi:MAG: ECF transporter S component [Chloroflexota bacterium]|nr:ECF transporter S component [Chloroflexota bacterium]
MSSDNTIRKPRYFSTRDLLIMTVLAALGGVASTYVNTLGDAVHAALGLPGATQWAAGLHVIWIVIAMGILHKPGTGIFIGILKGAVELLSGNSHGVIILLVNLIAGLLVDFVFLLFRKKQSLLPYLFGGGLASASNVLVFQLFATVPLNILGLSAILLLFIVALISGLVFAGVIPFLMVNTIIKAGVVKIPDQSTRHKRIGWWIILGVLLISVLLAGYLRLTYQGPPTVQFTGVVENVFDFPGKDFSLNKVSRKIEYKGILTEYSGYQLVKIIEYTNPVSNADTILLEASDGYAFLIGFNELQTNENILLVEKGRGKNTSYDIVGPESSKAWIRNVTKITVIAAKGLSIIDISDLTHEFDPDKWVAEMDSTQVALPHGSQKLQGVPAWEIIMSYTNNIQPSEVSFTSEERTSVFSWADLQNNDDLRVFTVIEEDGFAFALAEMSGEVHLFPLIKIEIE